MTEWESFAISLMGSPFFGIAMSVAAFAAGTGISRRLKSPLANPLLLATLMLAGVLYLLNLPIAHLAETEGEIVSLTLFRNGGDIIHHMLFPATAVLAMSVYQQLEVLKKNLLPVLCGCVVGALTAVGSVWLMCRAFGLNEVDTASLLPKSVTTAIAASLSAEGGGIPSVTVAAVVVTGIFGSVTAPLMTRLFRLEGNALATGVGIGASSHAAGTSRAIEMGELQGAASSIAIGVTGLATSLILIIV